MPAAAPNSRTAAFMQINNSRRTQNALIKDLVTALPKDLLTGDFLKVQTTGRKILRWCFELRETSREKERERRFQRVIIEDRKDNTGILGILGFTTQEPGKYR